MRAFGTGRGALATALSGGSATHRFGFGTESARSGSAARSGGRFLSFASSGHGGRGLDNGGLRRCRSFVDLTPAMGVAHIDHHLEDLIPGVWIHHHGVGEHAAIPANMTEGSGRLTPSIPQPIASMARNAQLAIRILRQAMVTRFVVRAGPFDGAVVLGHVKIDRPCSQ